MKIVHGFNEAREIVKKELHVSKNDGAFLRYKGEDTLIEPDINIWNKIYRPDDPSEGFHNAFYHITNECNKGCDYCYNRYLLQQLPGENDVSKLTGSLDAFVPTDTREVVPYREYIYDGLHPTISFIGGEPTVAESLIPFIEYIVSRGTNKMYVFTNGIKLLDMEYLKQFPNTSQIMFSISTDMNTTEEFVRTVTENLMKFNFEYGYNLVVGRTESTILKNLEVDAILRQYEPEEIRYRAFADQVKGTLDYASSMVAFIERSRGIPYDYYVQNANWGHGSIVSWLDYDLSENLKTGRVSIAVLPVWKRTFAEIQAKRGSFIINTTYINSPGECHMNSPALYKWRMENTKNYITKGTQSIWGKKNPFVSMRPQS